MKFSYVYIVLFFLWFVNGYAKMSGEESVKKSDSQTVVCVSIQQRIFSKDASPDAICRPGLFSAFLIGDVFHNVFNPALQNPAQAVQRADGNISIFSQRVQCTSAEVVFLLQFILRNTPFLHGLPKLCIKYHRHTSPVP